MLVLLQKAIELGSTFEENTSNICGDIQSWSRGQMACLYIIECFISIFGLHQSKLLSSLTHTIYVIRIWTIAANINPDLLIAILKNSYGNITLLHCKHEYKKENSLKKVTLYLIT